MLLVLALLVVLAAVTWPALEPSLASVELRKSAERIRVEWNQARVDALSTGRTVLFRYEPDANRYSLEYQPEPAFLPGSTGGGDDSARTAAEAQTREAVLPERISFAQGEISDGAMDAAALPGAMAGGEWSEPIVFYPDGSASNARLTLENERGQSIEVTLRGLTGVVSVSEVRSETEAAL
ncbi:MAG: hypothetical protein HUU20_18310 [Pirellulales bacterium]|nr:hypothetical protein [Pirellulales bacterium]